MTVYRTTKFGEYLDGLKAIAAYVRGVQARLGRPGFRQMEIDDAEAEHSNCSAWMKANGKRRSHALYASKPWSTL